MSNHTQMGFKLEIQIVEKLIIVYFLIHIIFFPFTYTGRSDIKPKTRTMGSDDDTYFKIRGNFVPETQAEYFRHTNMEKITGKF